MGILKFNDISIETPYELISILDIKLNHEISIHSTLEIHAICKEESFDPFYKTTLKDFVELKKDDKTVFKGLIGYYNTKRDGDLYSIIIKAVSATSLLDSQIKSQSFQDINMTYSNVISESIKDINGASFLFNLKDKTIDEPIIRYNETAWEFVNRLVSHFSSVLVCDIIENKPRFYFGFNKKNTINIDDSLFYESSKDLLSLNLSVDKLMDTDVFYHEIKSREVYELQDTVNFKNKTLFISSIKGEFIKSELIFTYKLSRLKGIRQNKIYNENIKGASLEGKVLDTKEELVKLHLNIDDKQDKATAYWFKVAQLTNNVFYIMYEKDTFSRLYFPSNKEVEAEVKNSVRKNGSTCPLTKKPENRYLTTKDKNQMSLKPSSVEFKSNEGLKLSTLVEDSFGAKLISHKNINLNSKGSISFHAKNMVNITAKTDVLFYRDNKLNPQSFTMENEFHYLGNNVLLEGADRSSYSSIGDDPLLVAPIKKSFDWGKLALGVLAGLAAVAAVTAVVATGGAALVAAGAITSATSAVTGAAVAGGIAVAAKAVTDIVRGEVSDITSYAMDGAIAAVCGAFSGAVEGAFAAANAFKAKLGVQMLSSIGSDAIEQIIRGEFDPISMGINVGIEIITLGCGELLTKTKIGKNISKKVSGKTEEIITTLSETKTIQALSETKTIQKISDIKKNISKKINNTNDVIDINDVDNVIDSDSIVDVDDIINKNKFPPRTLEAQQECQKVVEAANELKSKVGKRYKTTNPAVSVFTHQNGTVSVGLSGSNDRAKRFAMAMQDKLDSISPNKYKVGIEGDDELIKMMKNNDEKYQIFKQNKDDWNHFGNCAEPKVASAARNNNSKITGMDTRWRLDDMKKAYPELEEIVDFSPNPYKYDGLDKVSDSQMSPCNTCTLYEEEYMKYARGVDTYE